MKRNMLVGCLVGVTATLGLFAAFHSAKAEETQPLTGRIACISVEHVFQAYEAQAQITSDIEAAKQKLNTESTRRQEEIKALQAVVQNIDPSDPLMEAKQKELFKAQFAYQSWGKYTDARFTFEISRVTAETFEEINKAAAEIAQIHGFDMVLSKGPQARSLDNPDALMNEINSRRILYANPTADLTQVVIDHLNAQYRKSGNATRFKFDTAAEF